MLLETSQTVEQITKRSWNGTLPLSRLFFLFSSFVMNCKGPNHVLQTNIGLLFGALYSGWPLDVIPLSISIALKLNFPSVFEITRDHSRSQKKVCSSPDNSSWITVVLPTSNLPIIFPFYPLNHTIICLFSFSSEDIHMTTIIVVSRNMWDAEACFYSCWPFWKQPHLQPQGKSSLHLSSFLLSFNCILIRRLNVSSSKTTRIDIRYI